MHRLLAITFLFLCTDVGFGRAICGDTISIQVNGRDSCSPGQVGSWDALFANSKKSLSSAAQGNSSVQQQIQSAGLNTTPGECGRAAMYVSGGNQVTVRCSGARAPSTYAITMVHELCHVASHARASVGEYLAKFNSLGINCSGVSPYARCGSRNEMFAEACTAFLRAPARLKSGCTNAAAAEKFFKEMFPGAGNNNCANDVKDDNGQPFDGTVPPMNPEQFAEKDECGAEDGDEDREPSEKCKEKEKQDVDDLYAVCRNPSHKFYRKDFCTRLLNPDTPSGFRAAPGNVSQTGSQDQVSAGPTKGATLAPEELQDSEPAESGARETLERGTVNTETDYKNATSSDTILGTTEQKNQPSSSAQAEEYWDNFFASADDVEAQKIAEQKALEESGLVRKTGFSDAARREPAQKLEGPDYQGMTLKAVDGITGPFGRTIWIKVNQAYEEMNSKWESEDNYLRDNF